MTVDLATERAKQIRDARALLGWSRDRLASLAELTLTDLIHLERGTVGGRPRALEAVWRVLEAAGVEIPQAGTVLARDDLRDVSPHRETHSVPQGVERPEEPFDN